MRRTYRLTYSCALAFGLLIWAVTSGVGTTAVCAQGGCPAANFAPVTNFTVGNAPHAVTAGDFNGDGNVDLATANLDSGNVSVLLGDGAGGFGGPSNFPAGLGPNSVVAADFNGDGKSDLAVTNQSPSPGAPAHSVSILTGAGDGTFSAPADFPAGRFPRGMVTSDFTGDGKADVAVANSESNEIRVLPGTGTGGLGAAVVTAASQTGLSGVFETAVGDFNGDGKSDLVGLREKNPQPPFGPGGVTVFLGTGTGAFTVGDSVPVGINPSFVAVGSLNADAFSDLAVVNRASRTVSVLLGNGDGTFSATQSLNVGGIPESAAVADFNLDGRNDLAVPRQNGVGGDDVAVFLGDGAGGFSASGNFAIGSVPFDALTADFNEDGKSDLATANFTSNNVSVLLNNCGGAAAQSVFQFQQPTYVRSEEQTFLSISVVRTGLVSGAAAVDYATADGTASERSDYTTALGTLRFGPGETIRGFTVLLSEDSLTEGAESFTVALGNPSGGATLGARHTATVTINDDPSEPSANAGDDPELFVGQHYHDFLNRQADFDGLRFWRDEITSCGADAQCREVKRVNVSAAFFLSIENQETGYLAHRAYKAAYGNLPNKPVPLTFREYLLGSRQIGAGVQVGIGNWRQQLEANKVAFFNEFVNTPRFTTLYDGQTNEQYVDALNRNAGGALSQAESDALKADLASAAKTRAEVLRAVAEDGDFAQAEKNRAFVLAQYFGYLRRDPDAPGFDGQPDPNFDGYNFWLSKLEQFNGDFVQAEMVRAFISSIEYRRRFGQ